MITHPALIGRGKQFDPLFPRSSSWRCGWEKSKTNLYPGCTSDGGG